MPLNPVTLDRDLDKEPILPSDTTLNPSVNRRT
jgi:hypothetical protein